MSGFVQQEGSKLWLRVNQLLSQWRPQDVVDHFDDFFTLNTVATTGEWVSTQATAGTALVTDGHGGLVDLDSNSGTADQGIQLQRNKESFVIPSDGILAFEARLKLVDLVTDTQFFVGLAVNDTTVFASGENSTADHVGFEMNATSIAANPGKALLVSEVGGSRSSVANVHTFAEDTWVRLGFLCEYRGRVTAYINGEPFATAITATLTGTELAPTFVCQSEGNSDPILTLDNYRVVTTRTNP